MTPEQILIEMEKENTAIAIDFIKHYNHSDDERLIGIVEALDKKDKIILQQRLEIQAYNEAKAQEATVKESLTVQDLLTAHPLAEALRGFCDHTECDDNGYTIRGTCCSCEALTQHEALIKHSEAVWAVVESAKAWRKNVAKVWSHSDEHCSFKGVTHYREENPNSVEYDLAIAVEALEMMEVKKDA